MNRLQSVVLTLAALTIAGHSFVPPWVEYNTADLRGSTSGGLTIERPIGSHLLFNPPTPERLRFVRVDYGRLALYYLGTIVLTVPFFVWRRRSVPANTTDDHVPFDHSSRGKVNRTATL